MYNKLKITDAQENSLKQYHHVSLSKDVLRDCEMWEVFLNNASHWAVCHPMVDIQGIYAETVTLNFYSDASLNSNFGFGAIFNDRWIYGCWGRTFVLQNSPSIAFLELFTLVAAILTWGDRLINIRVVTWCDNETVKHAVNKLTSGCEQCMKLIRLLTLDNLKNNRRVFVKYVKSRDNVLADALSCLDFARFWQRCKGNQTPYRT